MDDEQRAKMIEAMTQLDTFAASTQLPRAWHVQWQILFMAVQALIPKPAVKPTPAKKPAVN